MGLTKEVGLVLIGWVGHKVNGLKLMGLNQKFGGLLGMRLSLI